jgi:galactoside O-acetyltransferase
LHIGKKVGVAAMCQINAKGGVTIGDSTLIGPGVMIWAQNHEFRSIGRPIMDQGYEYAPVRIDEDVWIGAGAIILPGVHLQRGSVVAAGAVVTRGTQPFSIVAGVPAKVIGIRAGSTTETVSGSEMMHKDRSPAIQTVTGDLCQSNK